MRPNQWRALTLLCTLLLFLVSVAHGQPGNRQNPAPPTDKNPSFALDEVAGVWKSTTDPSQTLTITVTARETGGVKVNGHFRWEGFYDAETQTLVLEKEIFAYDLNPEIPEWARTQV